MVNCGSLASAKSFRRDLEIERITASLNQRQLKFTSKRGLGVGVGEGRAGGLKLSL